MEIYTIRDNWELIWNDEVMAKGRIPASVYSMLLDSGKIEDPYYRENELKALPLSDHDYTFRTEFRVSGEQLKKRHIVIRFDGIDTLSDIYINHVFLGHTDNFFCYWEYDVKDILREGWNQLEVRIQSPVKYIKERDACCHVGGSIHAMAGFSQIRKPHCMFGWDWGPRLPDEGIWKDVKLLFWDSGRISDVRICQKHTDGVSLTVHVQTEGYGTVLIDVEDPDGNQFELQNGEEYLIKEPKLWWPNGLGDQNLYKVTVKMQDDQGNIAETIEKRVGLRTLTVCTDQDERGHCFAHQVNGQTFFAMGADYIPEDNIFSRITPDRTRKLLETCKQCHFNVIRVWGGGYYPSDEFYDACDELGLVVWQDLMFACAHYKLDDDFEENITEEIIQNVRRLRHHASLGLWCGNNEMEQLTERGSYDCTAVNRAHYIRINEHIIPHILKKEDPDTFYWPSSPSSGGSFDNPNSPDTGDVHNWDVWHAGVPFTEYRKHRFRYLSEFGFQGLPSMRTIEQFTEPEDRNIFSRVMDRHQRNFGANGKIMQYLSMTYRYPFSMELLVYASQLLQADAVRYGVEHFRRNRNENQCMGAIYWQLNDIWPVTSWSSVDYYGRWKALQYYAKRFFAPVMISCEEESEVTERQSITAEATPEISTARLCVTNETKKPVIGNVQWELRTPTGDVLLKGEQRVEISPFSSLWMDKLDFSETDFLKNHLAYRFESDNRIVSEGSVLFTAPKHYKFQNPELKISRNGRYVTVFSSAFAKSVELYSNKSDFVLSDNFFDMEPGAKTVEILEGEPDDILARSVYDIR